MRTKDTILLEDAYNQVGENKAVEAFLNVPPMIDMIINLSEVFSDVARANEEKRSIKFALNQVVRNKFDLERLVNFINKHS